jgi:hypothetical protein
MGFDNGMQVRIFGSTKREETGSYRKLVLKSYVVITLHTYHELPLN